MRGPRHSGVSRRARTAVPRGRAGRRRVRATPAFRRRRPVRRSACGRRLLAGDSRRQGTASGSPAPVAAPRPRSGTDAAQRGWSAPRSTSIAAARVIVRIRTGSAPLRCQSHDGIAAQSSRRGGTRRPVSGQVPARRVCAADSATRATPRCPRPSAPAPRGTSASHTRSVRPRRMPWACRWRRCTTGSSVISASGSSAAPSRSRNCSINHAPPEPTPGRRLRRHVPAGAASPDRRGVRRPPDRPVGVVTHRRVPGAAPMLSHRRPDVDRERRSPGSGEVTWIEASPELRNDLFGDEVEVVEIGQIKDLQVRRCAPASRYFAIAATTSSTVPAAPFSRSSSGSRPIAAARRRNSSSVAPPQQRTRPVDHTIPRRVAADGLARVSRLELARHDVDRLEHHVGLGGEAGRQCRRALLALAADDDRRR